MYVIKTDFDIFEFRKEHPDLSLMSAINALIVFLSIAILYDALHSK